MPTILALDEGTTGTTALVFDTRGQVVGRGYREITQHYPAPDQIEHDAAEIFDATVAAAREALAMADCPVEAIGITNQRETVVAWDTETLTPLGRAIVWQDRRTAPRCAELRAAGHESEIRERTGLLLDPYFSATKIEVLLRRVDVAAALARGRLAVGTIDSWLVAKLTGGVHVTDRTNASRTMLANLGTGAWDPWLLDLFGVPESILPRIVGSTELVGMADPAWFGAPLPITGIAGDQQAALFGQGADRPGLAKVTFGTGAFLLRYGGEGVHAQPTDGILATAAVGQSGIPGWAMEGSTFIAGAAVQWLRDGLGLLEHASESAALAASVASTDGVMFVPAFTGLGAPYWNPDARGTIVGLTRGTTRAHLVRATLEAIAHGTADLLDAMGGATELRVDGGAAANDWLMQSLADLLGVSVVRPALVELTAYGAARLAAIGIGRSLPAAAELGVAQRFEPSRPAAWQAHQRGEWRRAVDAALGWAESRVYSPAQEEYSG
ncbi:MAG TPA: glycerol kinase GlpK [Gemmatimonadales bacterium]|nr:glycerol kinase GlpK [Gemmatimonadales bacterium]